MSRDKDIHDMFNSIAARYDAANHILSFGLDKYWRKKAVKLANAGDGADVLDICCGTGDLTFAFGKYSRAASITGCDFSEEMLKIAKQKTKTFNNKKYDWVKADCATADFNGRKFDIISCGFGVRNLTGRTASLQNIRNLLKPDGKFCILEFSLPQNRVLRWFALCYLKLVPLFGAAVTANRAAYGYLSRTIQRWAETVDLRGELSAAGFADVKIYDLSFGIVRIYLAQ